MKAILLAGGYATRLRPLTEKVAKPLLPVGGRPMVDHIADKIDGVPQIDALHVVTNHKFAAAFEAWAGARRGRLPASVLDDGTTSNDDRLGALGDIRFTVERAGLDGQDLLIVAGDNLFEFSLGEYVRFWEDKGDGSSIALFECPDRELVKAYSAVEVDETDRVRSFVEKPADPQTSLVGIAAYVYHRDHVPLLRSYLAAGGSPDQPGNFIAWLHTRAPVYGFRFEGEWLDIGDHRQLLEADNRMRRRRGLPERTAYSLDG
jgi:glucose-1-phosphate thymidylyltransferase